MATDARVGCSFCRRTTVIFLPLKLPLSTPTTTKYDVRVRVLYPRTFLPCDPLTGNDQRAIRSASRVQAHPYLATSICREGAQGTQHGQVGGEGVCLVVWDGFVMYSTYRDVGACIDDVMDVHLDRPSHFQSPIVSHVRYLDTTLPRLLFLLFLLLGLLGCLICLRIYHPSSSSSSPSFVVVLVVVLVNQPS